MGLNINFEHIIGNGYYYAFARYDEEKTKNHLEAHFKSEAQKAKRDEFLEYSSFFNSLKREIANGKDDIFMQYYKELHKFDDTINSCAAGKGIKYQGVIITDTNDTILKDKLQFIENHKKEVREKGYNTGYCKRFTTGEIGKYAHLRYKDLEFIEQAIEQAEQELIGTNTSNTEKTRKDNSKTKQLHFTREFSETEQKHLFDGLVEGGYLPKETNYNHFCYVFGGTAIPDNEKPFVRLQWIKTNSRSRAITIRDLIQMLVLMGIPENEIKNKSLLNSIFEMPNGINANHYTELTDNKGNLKPFKSEYKDELSKIVSKSKEKQHL